MTRLRSFIAQYLLVILYIIPTVAGGTFIGYTIYSNRQIARDARATAIEAKEATATARRAAQGAHEAALDANRALCFQKASVEYRLKTAQDFLRAHPNGTADFPPTLINRAIRNAQADRRALLGINCRKVKRD